MNKKRTVLISLTMVIFLMVNLTGCKPSSDDHGNPSDPPLSSLASEDNVFASYQEVTVNSNPSIAPYQVSADLSNITNRDRFVFSEEAESLLVKNGFLVIPSRTSEFFSTYEMNRYDMTPNFITTDAMMHNYHLYFSYLLRTMEKETLRGTLNALTNSMLEKSQQQYNDLKGTDWEIAAKRNLAFFAVAANLLDPKSEIPSPVSKEVKDELELISNHQETFTPSPVMNMGAEDASSTEALKEDYTQYIPRGHYTKSDELKTYFQAMMWYGRMTFRAANEDETKSAALITLMLNSQRDYTSWNSIYEPTNFFVGKSDDLGFVQYYQLMKDTYNGIPALDELTDDSKSWKVFLDQIDQLDPPALNSMPIYDETIQPDKEEVIQGFRFMGQRFTLDASIFQKLIYREVGENKSGERRMLPKGLDIPAAMGSAEALSILKEMGETDYDKYSENMKKMQNKITGLDMKTRTQNLYWSWLYTLEPLTESKGPGYPSFMQNSAWERKQLVTYLGSWTELKHDTVLYAKQVYAEMGGGEEPQDDRGYVEPNPEVYGRLAALTRMTIDGLGNRSLLTTDTKQSLEELETLALKLKTISEKELAMETLTDEEYDLIRSFGGQLEHFWLQALKDEGVDSASSVFENPAALVADVATDPNGQVLEEGTGYISDIYAVVPIDGTLRIAKGGVYSYYEFSWPSVDRLTDDKWKSMLENGEAPESPAWTETFTAPEGASQW